MDETWLRRVLVWRNHIVIAHHIPGRIRLRLQVTGLDLLYGAGRDAGRLPFADLPGIRSWRINRSALSAVIDYDRKVLPPSWWQTMMCGSEDEVRALTAALSDLWGNTVEDWQKTLSDTGRPR